MSVDYNYQRKKLKLIFRDLEQCSAEELSRTLLRLAKVAEHKVFAEEEFTTETGIKISQLEKENAELKAQVNNLNYAMESIVDEGKLFDFEDMIDILEMNPKQSLAQHDKEVAVKALMDFRKYLDEQGFKSVQKSVINKYAEQLQEQE